jgi:hypothetical protein
VLTGIVIEVYRDCNRGVPLCLQGLFTRRGVSSLLTRIVIERRCPIDA